MDKLKMHSPDLSQDNIAKIRDLFPGCVTEARDEVTGAVSLALDFDQLRQELSNHIVEGPQERYRLDWPGKREALALANAPINKALRPVPGESLQFDTTKNLFIEGDNLEALKLIQDTYLGQVKLVYIDPPYNTGKDFIYRDTFASDQITQEIASGERTEQGARLVANPDGNGRFHSAWLSMIYPRVKVARNLLREDGVIFISIDENEYSNIKKVCEEVFGGSNFVGTIVLQTATDNNETQINIEHEYIICFAKNKSALEAWSRPSEAANLIGDQYLKLRSKYGSDNAAVQSELRKWIKENKDSLPRVTHYDNVDDRGVFHDGDVANTKFGGYEYEVPHPVTGRPCKIPDKGFRFPKNTMEQMIAQDDILFGADETTLIKPKKRLETVKEALRSIIYEDGRSSTKVVENLLARDVFKNPKSHTIIGQLVEFATVENDLILDFFAGSGTTAHAVLDVNARTGSNRSFLVVQLDEPIREDDKDAAQSLKFVRANGLRENIAELAKERIRRAGKKILEGECHTDWNRDVGFRVLKVDTSNMKDVYYRPDELKQSDLLDMVDNVKEDRTSEDLLFQVLVDWGVDLTLPIHRETVQGKTVFFVDDNALVACFDRGVTEELVKELAKREPLRVVFRDNGFVSDAVKINVEQIFRQLSPSTDVKAI